MPAVEPSIHISVPLVLAALRGLPALIASDSAVVVSTEPLESTRAMTRLTLAEVELVILAVAKAASYPGAIRYLPSADLVINPSLVAVPLAVNLLFEALTTVGIAIDCTRVPPVVYSSRKTAVALLARAALPSPTR